MWTSHRISRSQLPGTAGGSRFGRFQKARFGPLPGTLLPVVQRTSRTKSLLRLYPAAFQASFRLTVVSGPSPMFANKGLVWNTVTHFYLYVVCDSFRAVMAELSSSGRDNMTCKASNVCDKKLAFLGESSQLLFQTVRWLPGGLEFLTPTVHCLLPDSGRQTHQRRPSGVVFEGKANSVEVHKLLRRPTA